ncbi:hypothetical protein N9T16_03220 [Pelagibacteraceae bacterium]|nr:hypothetical protein [Pelagibacteraceae bacterium]
MKRQFYIFIISLFLIIFLTGCTGTGVPINSFDKSFAESQVGKVYVLRDFQMTGKASVMTIHLNDNLIGEIGEGEIAEGQVHDGKNLLSISNVYNVPAQLSFIGNTSKNYYFKTRYLSPIEAISSSSISNINIKIDRVDSDFQIYDN